MGWQKSQQSSLDESSKRRKKARMRGPGIGNILQNGHPRGGGGGGIYKGDSSPTYPHESPINYPGGDNMTTTSSRPQRSCARFSFCYIENFSDDENTQG